MEQHSIIIIILFIVKFPQNAQLTSQLYVGSITHNYIDSFIHSFSHTLSH